VEYTVFYSWQFDLPSKSNRKIIKEALESAINRVSKNISIESSPRLDHDTKDVSGTPDISGTIFEKIRKCGLFVADVSFIGSTNQTDGNKNNKLLPNPNVLLELGYAASSIGWERIVLVMNENYGKPEELIFDLKNRRFPVTYKYDATTDKKSYEEVLSNLSDSLEERILLAVREENSAVQFAITKLSMNCLYLIDKHSTTEGFKVGSLDREKVHYDSQIVLDYLAIDKLMELGLIKLIEFSHDSYYQYNWTYLGRLVIDKVKS